MSINKNIIFFCGNDRCGKSTTRKAFASKTGEKHVTFDRGPIDNLVYDEFYRKQAFNQDEIQDFLGAFARLSKQVWVVYLSVDYDVINERAQATENISYAKKDLVEIESLFMKYFGYAMNVGMRIMQVDATGKTVDAIVTEIKTRMGL